MSIWEDVQECQARRDALRQSLVSGDHAATFAGLTTQLSEGRISLANIGGFSSEQLASAFGAATRLIEAGKYGDALQIAGFLIVLEPREPRFCYLAGLCYHRAGDYPTALRYYEAALATREDAVTYAAMGEALLMHGDRDGAKKNFERAAAVGADETGDARASLERAAHLLNTYCRESV